MKCTTPETLTGCRITITNQITGERTVKHSPQTVKEALADDGDCDKARTFIESAEMAEFRDCPEPVGCSIRHSEADSVIEIDWYAIDNAAEAEARLREVLTLDWRCWS